MTAPLEKLLKKDTKFQWTTNFKESLDKLKNKMETVPILVFPDTKEFHVHVGVSSIALGVVLSHPDEG